MNRSEENPDGNEARHWQVVKAVFSVAESMPGDQRAKFLDKACAGDGELRIEVEKLLSSLDSASGFLESPAVDDAGSLFKEDKTLLTPVPRTSSEGRRLLPGTILASRYRVLGLVGKGGMGEVYQAEDIKLEINVALKFLPDRLEADAASLERFLAEVRTARSVAHPNVCRVFDIGEIDWRHFISMEFVDGDDLSSLLRRVGRLSSERAVEISRQLCVGLHAIHEAGIIHRDLKPANIIIDSKGKPRITDFGVAGIAEDVASDRLRVGTPAYMSPEQIVGQGISTRSDIYSLGLVLYEIFTGKQAFVADSIPDLIRKHESELPTNPSEHVKGIDPLVEQVIFQCLEKRPEDRPPTALHIALALPGGNPMQVALDAGETPSPEMVAAAPKKGALKPVVGLAMFIGVILCLALSAVMSQRTHLHRMVPLERSAEVLRDRAREISTRFGYSALDHSSRFTADYGYIDHIAETEKGPDRWEHLRAGQPAVLEYWYAQSPRPMYSPGGFDIHPNDRIIDQPGMAEVRVDTRGRLTYFAGVPDRTTSSGVPVAAADWKAVLDEAALDISALHPSGPLLTPPQAFDERRTWTGSYPDRPDIPVTVEAASFRGKPVYFEIVEPWDRESEENAGSSTAATVILISIFFGILVVSAFFAYRHVRSGRSDLRGAFRCGLILFVLRMLMWLSGAHHIASLDEVLHLLTGLQSSLFWAGFGATMYLAFEPYFRRHTPERVISWNRLLAGNVKDPLVGRDILIGVLAAGLTAVGAGLRGYLPQLVGDPPVMPFLMSNPMGAMLHGLSGFLPLFFAQVSSALVQGFMISFLLLFFTIILKRGLFAAAVTWLVLFSFSLSGDIASGTPVSGMTFAIAFPTLLVVTARLGVLTAISALVTYHLMVFFPLTTQLTAWYAGDIILEMTFLLALAAYGFYTSLSGQRLFTDRLLPD